MIYLTIGFTSGRRIEAVLLAAGKNEMRIAAPGQADAMSFRLVDGHWTSEDGEQIELESLFQCGQTSADAGIGTLEAAAAAGPSLWM